MILNREAGYIVHEDPGSDKPVEERMTQQCCHCGKHWVVRPGSGKLRGFCTKCNGFFCGPNCPAMIDGQCIAHEKHLDILEGKVHLIGAASVPVSWSCEPPPKKEAKPGQLVVPFF